jgi:hypothetical protein
MLESTGVSLPSLNNEELAELAQLIMEETRADDNNVDKAEIHQEKGLALNGLREVFESTIKLLIIVKIMVLFLTPCGGGLE